MNIIPVAEITDNDILLGRGKAVHIHEGNIRFRKLVAEHASGSLPSAREQKAESRREAAVDIINTVRARGGRFLKPCSCAQQSTAASTQPRKWETVGIVATLAKVRQALRDSSAKLERDEKKRQQARRSSVVAISSPTENAAAIRQDQGFSPRRNSEHIGSSSLEPANSPERPYSHYEEHQERMRLLSNLRAQQHVRRIELLRTEQLLAARREMLLQGPIDNHRPSSAERRTSPVLSLLLTDRSRQLQRDSF